MIVTLTAVEAYRPFDTVLVFRGYDQATGRSIKIGIDHRPARNVVDQLAHGWDVEANVENWQVLA